MNNYRHPMQSPEWGEFRKQTGVMVVASGDMLVTIHRIPHTPYCVGYAPKISKPMNQKTVEVLQGIARDNNCIFIKCEPLIELQDSGISKQELGKMGFVEGRAMFTKYNFVLDVSKSEEMLLASFKQKTRYNIKVAEKRGVEVMIDDSEEAFARYLELSEETTNRQGFYAHSRDYHTKMWETLHNSPITNSQILKLTAHLLVAKYQGEIITTWVLFKYGDTLYYPYGASTREHREVMANNLVMWSAIKLAKSWGLHYLDMWGALGPEPDKNDLWYGFHTFKAGYGARHVEYIGTWDYVDKPVLYKVYRFLEALRWKILRLLK